MARISTSSTHSPSIVIGSCTSAKACKSEIDMAGSFWTHLDQLVGHRLFVDDPESLLSESVFARNCPKAPVHFLALAVPTWTIREWRGPTLALSAPKGRCAHGAHSGIALTSSGLMGTRPASADAALDCLATPRAIFDVVLSDIAMPGSIHGRSGAGLRRVYLEAFYPAPYRIGRTHGRGRCLPVALASKAVASDALLRELKALMTDQQVRDRNTLNRGREPNRPHG